MLNIGEFNYYVPISSSRSKHYKMKESMDFVKIIDKKGAILGVLNLNNMIPILSSNIKALKYTEIDSLRFFNNEKEKQQYLTLLTLELKIINSKAERIQHNAAKLYELKDSKPESKLAKRCCDFRMLEKKAIKYKKG